MMPPTGSFPWHCDNCGRVNDGGQLTCTLCGGLYKSGNPPGTPPALAYRPGKGRISRRFFLICLTVILSAGGLVFAYLSYTPFRTIHAFQMSNGISSVAWSPDSRVFAAVTFGGRFGTSIAMVGVWRASDGREPYTYSYYPSTPLGASRLAWAPDGSSFAIAWDDGNVNIWGAANDYASWQEQSSFLIPVHASTNLYLTGLAWSADGNQAIVREQQTYPLDATYVIWDWNISTGKVIPLTSQSLNQDALEETHGAWSPDGNALAVSVGGKVMSWQWNKPRNSWTFVRSIAVATFGRVIIALAWSPDGKLLATADSANVIRMWSTSTGDLLGPFRLPLLDHPNSKIEEYTDTDNLITGLAWSPNGTYLLSGNSPGQVILRLVLWRWGLA